MFFRAEHGTSEAQATQEVEQLDITEEQHEEAREEDDKYTGKHNFCRNLLSSFWENQERHIRRDI